jgi:hypothetical protein
VRYATQYARLRPPMRISVTAWVVLMAAGIAAWACSGSPPHPPYSPQPSSALTAVTLPPPPARVEVVPKSPAKGAVWIDGEWSLRRGRWSWVRGRWVMPLANATYSPWTLTRASNGEVLHAPGAWRDADGGVLEPPAALALAAVQAGPVVDSEGVSEVTGRNLQAMPKEMATPEAGVEGGGGEGGVLMVPAADAGAD